jgi:hypothetical protein
MTESARTAAKRIQLADAYSMGHWIPSEQRELIADIIDAETGWLYQELATANKRRAEELAKLEQKYAERIKRLEMANEWLSKQYVSLDACRPRQIIIKLGAS